MSSPKLVEKKTEELSPEDTAYLKALIKQQEAVQIKISGFSEYMTPKYKLAEGDTVSPEGIITRK